MSVLVYIENWDGKFKKPTYELLTYAHDLSKALGQNLVGLSIGDVDVADLTSLQKYGLSRVLTASGGDLSSFKANAYTTVLASAMETANVDVVVMGNTYNGKSMGPRLAAKMNAGIVTGAISLPDTSNGFIVKTTVFSNKGFGLVNLKSDKKIITLNINSYKVEENEASLSIETLDGVDGIDGKVNITDVQKQTGKVSLTEAELVVSAGRGLKGPENWEMVEELADLIGAATACSKPVSDVGWRPHSEHVGQTGITIGPNLYIAIGISGAIQHLAGVSSSKTICVVNKDPEAPFFQAADYGIVGDAFEVVPKLIEAVKNLN